MKRIYISAAIFLMATAAVSCKKYQPKGDYQEAGTYTTAKSTSIILHSWSSKYDDGNNFLLEHIISTPDLGTEFNASETIMLYFKDEDGFWVAMPYTTAGDSYSFTLNFKYNNGVIIVSADGYDDAGSYTVAEMNAKFYEIKVVSFKNFGMPKNPDVDLMNYESVQAAYDL